MNKKSLALFFISLILFMGHDAMAANITGRWEASIMGHRVKAVAEQKGQNVSGVAYLYDPFGHKTTWHFNGTIHGNNIQAAHHDGHKFVGKVVSEGKMSGTLETNNGFHIPLDIYSVR